ncbi:Centromeric protein E, partial [Reticulomyxa filosa]
CNFKGKMKDLKDHLDKSCNLIPVKQSIPLEIVNELNVITKQMRELQNVVKIQIVLSYFLFEQIKDLKVESLKKDEQIFELTKDIQQFKMEMSQTIVDLKKQQNQQNQQIGNLKHELQEKDQTINSLKINNIELNKQLEQYQIKFNEYKQNVETK